MKIYKTILSLTLITLTLLLAVYTPQEILLVNMHTEENETVISKVNSKKISIDDEFSDDRVLVVVDMLNTMTFKEYLSTDFTDVGVKNVENLTKESTKLLYKQLNAFEQNKSFNSINKINTETYREILSLTLDNPGKKNVLEAIDILNKRDDIISAEPDIRLNLETTTPNDPYYTSGSQWSLNNINITQAWGIATGSNSIKVGVIDSGIDAAHPDLKNRVDTSASRDFSKPYPYTISSVVDIGANSHGTHVAGIIGAEGNNNIGITGVNQNVSLVSLRINPTNLGYSFASHLILAVDYATSTGIKVLNNSNGTDSFTGSGSDINALKTAIANYPGLFVTSAGNGNKNNDLNNGRFPSNIALDNLISVGSLDQNNQKSSFSNYGATTVSIYAPGDTINSTLSNGNYGTKSGTSMAAPHVAGVAALILSKYPSLNGVDLKKMLLTGSDTININTSGSTSQTVKKLNAYKALSQNPPTHVHSYNWSYTNVGNQHREYCICGNYILRAHIGVPVNVNDRYIQCWICGDWIDTWYYLIMIPAMSKIDLYSNDFKVDIINYIYIDKTKFVFLDNRIN